MTAIAAPRPATPWLKLAVAAALVLLLAVTAAVLTRTFVRDGKAEVSQELTADSEDAMAAKAAIEARAPKATAISFDHVFNHWTGDIVAVCGRVDITEDQDSFEGFERFVYVDGQLTLEESDGSDAVAQKWDDMCA